MKNSGQIHLYTGDGKGKTTAALGLILRCCGADRKALLIQFMKKGDYSEIKALSRFADLVTVEQYGTAGFYDPAKDSYLEHRALAKKGYDRAVQSLSCGEYGIIVLDEIMNALKYGLLTYEEIVALTDMDRRNTELVLTGRDAPSALFERCGLVTEMKEIRHYYKTGLKARIGIES